MNFKRKKLLKAEECLCVSGNTYFYHRMDEDKTPLACKEFGWQIDANFDSRVDCSQPVRQSNSVEDFDPWCSDKYLEECKDGMCQTQRSGIYACVRECSSRPIYPFNPHSGVVDTYIVTVANQKCELIYFLPLKLIKQLFPLGNALD